MPRTTAGLRTKPTARLAELERQRPEWRAWLKLLGEVEAAVAAPEPGSRTTPIVRRESGVTRPTDFPLLHGCTLRVNLQLLQRLFGRLTETASAAELESGASFQHYRPEGEEALRVFGACVEQNREETARLAASRGLDEAALASLFDFAVLPTLRAAGQELSNQIPQHWPHGYCPVCGAWPVLVERRGLDRSRQLRCGRCASEWEMEWLTCAYCGERNHQRLGSLVCGDGDETLKVETCGSCRGYLKSLATLQTIPASELLLRDLETVELDLIARERGYERPEHSAVAMRLRVVSGS
jgi:FdhE protein